MKKLRRWWFNYKKRQMYRLLYGYGFDNSFQAFIAHYELNRRIRKRERIP